MLKSLHSDFSDINCIMKALLLKLLKLFFYSRHTPEIKNFIFHLNMYSYMLHAFTTVLCHIYVTFMNYH